MKVLIVDDHALFGDGLAVLLEKLDPEIEIHSVRDCQSALAFLAQQLADLVLLDLGLPDMPGVDVLTLLRQQYPDVPVVILSGTQDRGIVLQAIKSGAMGFVPKTHSADLLLGALRFILLHKGIYLPPELIFEREHEPTSLARAKITRPADLGLTARQADVLYLVLQGKSNKAIARNLGIEENTVRAHLSPVLRSLNVTTRAEAIVAAHKIQLVFSETASGINQS